MDQGTCRIGEGDCSKTGKLAGGWCPKHYQRLRKRGDPFAEPRRIFGDDIARFWSYVDRAADDQCWLWTGHVDDGGYGVIGIGKKLRKVHVWAYETFIGAIPEDLPQLDHDCHSRVRDTCSGGDHDPHRRCVNFLQDVGRPHLKPMAGHQNTQLSRATKYQDDYLLSLHARWLAGERAVLLAAEAGTPVRYLYQRFGRITPYEPGSHRGTDRAPAIAPADGLKAITGDPQELPGLFDAAS